MKLNTRDTCMIALFVAIIAICAQIAIPLPGGVPFTLQTWAILLAGLLLGSKKGAIATIAYLLLGAVGVPVFANFSSGFFRLIGPTGGFLLSFPIMAYISGLGAIKNKTAFTIGSLLLGVIINFICGMLIFMLVVNTSINVAFSATVLPFIPSSAFQIVMVMVVGSLIKNALKKSGIVLH